MSRSSNSKTRGQNDKHNVNNRRIERSQGLPLGTITLGAPQSNLERLAPGRIEQQLRDIGVVVALPQMHDENCELRRLWPQLLQLTDDETRFEVELSRACSGGVLGFSREQDVLYAFPDRHGGTQPNAAFSKELIASMRNLGWEQRHFDQLRNTVRVADDVHDRTVAASGWLICHREFRDARDALRRQWSNLQRASRPPLPLFRSARFEQKPENSRSAKPDDLTEFQRKFDAFCDEWRLLGLITWELPNADGPKWTENYPGRPATLAGVEVRDTPWHFPVMGRDGLGEMQRATHTRVAHERGFTDQGKWTSYASILQIHFWEHVARNRITGMTLPKGFVGNFLKTMSNLLRCDEGRVKRLRRQLKEFLKGERTSLKTNRRSS